MDNLVGESKCVLKYLVFLVTEYNMQFTAQEFSEYLEFHFICYTYSFYNKNGCFTIHHIPQRGDTLWYVSKSFSEDHYELLEKRIWQRLYVQGSSWLFSTGIKKLAASIRSQITKSGAFFEIRVTE